MRYDQNDRESNNVEDRRGEGGGRGPLGGGGMGGFPMGGRRGGMSITTLLIVGAIMLLFGINPLELLGGGGGFPSGGQVEMPRMPRGGQDVPPSRSGQPPFELPRGGANRASADQEEVKRFVARVLADTEDVWGRIFQTFGKTYEEPKLVLFSGALQTACGTGQSAMGPFYCPLDRKIYIDLAFFGELQKRFNSPGDFAQAYVVSHEVGHHVQTLLGIADAVERKKRSLPEREANQWQVKMELQADCLAGVWASLNDRLHKRLQPGDVEEGLNAAKQIGDDMIQRQQTGRVVRDSFTHGSSEQRTRWFRRGLDSGQMQQCDTFSASQL